MRKRLWSSTLFLMAFGLGLTFNLAIPMRGLAQEPMSESRALEAAFAEREAEYRAQFAQLDEAYTERQQIYQQQLAEMQRRRKKIRTSMRTRTKMKSLKKTKILLLFKRMQQ